MRVLLIGDETTRGRWQDVLKSAGHVVRVAADERHGVAAAQQESPHVVVLCGGAADGAVVPVVGRLRETLRNAPVLLLASPAPSESIGAAWYRAGLDGELRPGASDDYVVARFESLQRRLDPTAVKAANAAATSLDAGQGLGMHASLQSVQRAAAWRGASNHLKDAASKFLTLPGNVVELRLPGPRLAYGCEILLANAQLELECRVAVGADAGSAHRLAVHLFGDEGEEMLADTLPELANILMGTMKTTFGNEQLAFTGGLPKAVAVEEVLRPEVTFRLQESFLLAFPEASVVVHLGVRSKANLAVMPGSLREGMVLARDLLNGKGLLLVPGGTRLSLNMVERLQKLLPPKFSVEVTG